jgi:hypothetical protein
MSLVEQITGEEDENERQVQKPSSKAGFRRYR